MRLFAAVIWAVLVVAAGAHFVYVGQTGGLRFGSDLLALLPQADRDPVRREAIDAVTASLNRRFVVVIGHPEPSVARSAAARIGTELHDTGAVEPELDASSDIAGVIGRLYFRHRAGLLSSADRQRLRDGRGSEIADRALGQVFGLVGGGGALLKTDPFQLLPAFIESLPLPESRFSPVDGMLKARDGGKWWVLQSYRLRGEAYVLAQQATVVEALNRAYAEASKDYPDLVLLRTGAVFFAHAGAQSALQEMTRIGVISVLGIVAMVLVVFRSARPLWLSLLAIAVGLVCALSICLAVFHELHVIALLFGASLIGMTVDYSMHYCCETFAPDSDPHSRLRHVLPGMLLGVVTTLIGYLALLLAPFSGLHQVAIFSAIGVTASFATVVFWFPVLDRRGGSPAGDRWVRLTGRFWNIRDTSGFAKFGRAVAGILALGAIAGTAGLELVDDIRRMQSPPPDLLHQQAEIRRLSGIGTATSYFLVQAPDTETALQREELLAHRLGPLREAAALKGFRGPAGFVPSQARQQDNARLIRDRLLSTHLVAHRARLGLPAVEGPAEQTAQPLTLLEAVGVLPILKELVLKPGPGGVRHVVLLDEPTDTGSLRQAAAGIEGVDFVDPASDYSNLLRLYRQAAMVLVAVSAILMIGALALRYRLRGSIRVMAPPVAAIALTPGLLALAGHGFSFFDAMALVLVLAVGVDYAVFCAEAPGSRKPVTLIAITLAAFSTLLAFGLLAFSGTAAVAAFGATMLCGVALAYLFSPFAAGVSRRAVDVS